AFMDNISPLAKTLAESNGIDWRSIQGTGDGGQVVEQDIINYLTRVMSGEEEPPATPLICRRPTGPATSCPQA
ncbi:E3 binding domain-containing protein, partial [Deinococcus radiophilus]|uniref:E3 binding domain-containing protein n=1 Tax=Deinococcus radiophilus TaxID=32062 RepID=UPI00361F16CE